jgi:hypothetical protein
VRLRVPLNEEPSGAPLARDAYRDLIRAARSSIFRLQVHPVYLVEAEQEEFQQFLDTGQYEVDPDDPVLVSTRERAAAGIRVQRVYVVAPPLTSYQRFVFIFYRHVAEAGEDLRVIDTTHTAVPGLPTYDFMLIDDETVIKISYASDGTYLGPELLERASPQDYVAYRERAVTHSVPFLEYLKTVEG